MSSPDLGAPTSPSGKLKPLLLIIAALLSLVGLVSSLRILIIEATVPYSIWLDETRLFQPQRLAQNPASILQPEKLRPWLNDASMLHREYAVCAAARQDAMAARDLVAFDHSQRRCLAVLRHAIDRTPAEGRLWLEIAMTITAVDGLTGEAIEALKASYKTSPREGWIADTRLQFALLLWSALPEHMKDLAIQDALESWAKLSLADALLSPTKPRDEKRAHKLLQQAAEMGDAQVMEKVGLRYLSGDGVGADPIRGRDFLERAIAAGNIGAQITLAEAFIKGHGVPKDTLAGLKLLEAAALQDEWGKLALGKLLLSGDLPRNVPRALSLLQASAEKGNPYALEKLGQLYLLGDGVQSEPIRGRDYLERAMAAGNIGAQITLGEVLIKGYGIPKNTPAGLELLKAAAQQDDWGKVALAKLLLSGDLPRDTPRALSLLQAAAENGNSYALQKLRELNLANEVAPAGPQKVQDGPPSQTPTRSN